MIYHFNTIFSGDNIALYYNKCCEIVPENQWICLWDADVMTFHTFANINHFLEDAIKKYPDIKLFGCMASRSGRRIHRLADQIDNNPDMLHHRAIAEKIMKKYKLQINKDINHLSGFMMLFNKDTWKAVGGFPEGKILSIDTKFSEKVKAEIGEIAILKGLYVMHYYRLAEKGKKTHLIR